MVFGRLILHFQNSRKISILNRKNLILSKLETMSELVNMTSFSFWNITYYQHTTVSRECQLWMDQKSVWPVLNTVLPWGAPFWRILDLHWQPSEAATESPCAPSSSGSPRFLATNADDKSISRSQDMLPHILLCDIFTSYICSINYI